MIINKINSMTWGNKEHTVVSLLADTNEGNNLSIGTPYDTSSIIWDAVQAFPVDQIAEYVEPNATADIESLQAQLLDLQNQINALAGKK
jgi:hypothetical protein